MITEEIDDLALLQSCTFCRARSGAWCKTKSGNRSKRLHDARTGALWTARSQGYREGHVGALRSATHSLLSRREGDRWAIRDLVPLTGLDVIAWLDRWADRGESL